MEQERLIKLENSFQDMERKLQDLEKENKELKRELDRQQDVFKKHGHTGDDDSVRLRSNLELPEGTYIKTGCSILEGISYGTGERNSDRFIGAWSVGNDLNPVDGSNNSQISIEHQFDGLDTFMYGFRGPFYTGSDASITSGGTTMSQSTFNWTSNELAGAFVIVTTAPGEFDFFEITSNTSSQLTITGGTWSSSESGADWTVFMPIYLGSAQFPWRRIYTLAGTTGGLRFGGGDTNGGQNGLLYMDSAGDLYWRDEAGTSTKLN
jgi:hypothetical protein